MTFPAWLNLTLALFGVLSLLTGAVVIVRSKYRKATDEEREDYIKALEDRNKLLEATVTRQEKEIEKAAAALKDAERHYHELRGSLNTVAALAMGRCPHFDLDPESGGCVHCDRGLYYGKEGKKG